MKKTFLILINDALNMAKHHLTLGTQLKNDGHEVIYAIADYYAIFADTLDFSDEKTYIFSDFFKKNYYSDIDIPDKYKSININKLFFPDFDRMIVHYRMKPFRQTYYEKLMTNLFLFFDSIYSNHKIDICLYEAISNSFAYTAYQVSKVNNVVYCGYAGSRLKGRFELYTEEYGEIELFNNEFYNLDLHKINEKELKEIDNYLTLFTTNKNVPSYHPRNTRLDWNYSLFKKYFNKERIKLIIGIVKLYCLKGNTIKYAYQMRFPIKTSLISFIKQILKYVKIPMSKQYFDKMCKEDKYVLYPLHFKPESSVSVLAMHYSDDISVIKNIAFNLPFGTKLYVKEHFVNYGRPPLGFYKSIKEIPNVKLISCEENIKKIIENSQAIITLTSTVGFEALMMNKPVIVFGEVFYQCHPNCIKLNSYGELFNILNKEIKLNMDVQTNRKFIAAYRNITFKGNIDYSVLKDNDFVQGFKMALYKRYNINSTC
jgi:hypothetical protein